MGPHKREGDWSESGKDTGLMEAKLRKRFEEATLLTVTMEDVAGAKECRLASRRWKRPGNPLLSRTSRKNTILLKPGF